MSKMIDWFAALTGWQWAIVVCVAVLAGFVIFEICAHIQMGKKKTYYPRRRK